MLRYVCRLARCRCCSRTFVSGCRLILTFGNLLSAACRLRLYSAFRRLPHHGNSSSGRPATLHYTPCGAGASRLLRWLGASPLRFTLRRLALGSSPERPPFARSEGRARIAPTHAGVSNSPAFVGAWLSRCPPLGARFYYLDWCFPAPLGRMALGSFAATTPGGIASVSVRSCAPYRSRNPPSATMRHAAYRQSLAQRFHHLTRLLIQPLGYVLTTFGQRRQQVACWVCLPCLRAFMPNRHGYNVPLPTPADVVWAQTFPSTRLSAARV